MTANTIAARVGRSWFGRVLLVVLTAVSVAVLATLLPEDYRSGMLLAILLLYVLVLALSPLRAHPETKTLFNILIASLVVHIVAAVALHSFAQSLESDALLYAGHGSLIAESWREGRWVTYEQVAPFVIAPGYTYLNAVVYYVAGYNPLLVKLLNATMGALIALPLYFLSRHFFSHKVSILASGLVAFMPSLLFWSTQNLKDTLVVFLSIVMLLLAVRIGEKKGTIRLAGQALLLLLSILYLYYLRAPTGAFLLFWVLLIMGLRIVRERSIERLALALVLGGLVVAVFWQANPIRDLTQDAVRKAIDVEELDRWRSYRAYGGSAFGETLTLDSYAGLLRNLPTLVAAYLLRPFPWEVDDSLFQQLTVPEMIFLYGIFLAALGGFVMVVKRSWIDYFLIWAYPISVVLISAPQYGNLGTSYRHRGQVIPMFLILASVAIVYWLFKQDPFRESAPLLEDDP